MPNAPDPTPEIRAAVDLARHYSNVNAIVVGNEALTRRLNR